MTVILWKLIFDGATWESELGCRQHEDLCMSLAGQVSFANLQASGLGSEFFLLLKKCWVTKKGTTFMSSKICDPNRVDIGKPRLQIFYTVTGFESSEFFSKE